MAEKNLAVVDFLGHTITAKRVAPQKQEITKLLKKVKFPLSKRTLQRYFGFLYYYRNYIPRFAKRLAPFFQLLKTMDGRAKFPITPDMMRKFTEINEAVDQCY